MKVVGGAGAALSLGSFAGIGCAKADATEKSGNGAPAALIPDVFLKINPDSTVEVTVYRSDMGQGVRTSMAMLIAEELDADWTKIKVLNAPADVAQGTGGSSSIRTQNQKLRQIGAVARYMLVAAAAKKWGVDSTACTTEAGKVTHAASGNTAAYGELTNFATEIVPPPTPHVKLKKPADFKIIGKPTLRVDNLDVVTGKAMFGADVKVEGMKYAALSRPPCVGATVKGFDDSKSKLVPGYVSTFRYGTAVAIVADNSWAAMRARDVLKVDWILGKNALASTESVHKLMVDAIVPHPVMPAGSKIIEATYDLPYIAHATMEPMNAVADVRADSCELWAGMQSPDGALGNTAQQLGIPAGSIKVHNMLLGGGFGRRGNPDYVYEAVMVSKDAKCPIKLIWSREDDMRHDNYRPASHHALCGALDANNKPVGFSHQFIQANGRSGSEAFSPGGITYGINGSCIRRGGVETPLVGGAWRSVESTQIILAVECFIDEMAHAAGMDPLAFRLSLTGIDRWKNCMKMAAEKAGWGTPLPHGSGRGIAAFAGFQSFIAHVAQVRVVGDQIKVERVVAAVDVGQVVNPQGVEAQVQGACSDSLALALRAEITVKNGSVVQGSWDDYPWTTMDTMPKMEVHIIHGSDEFGGMGELGIPSVPPAVANAVFAATGKRVRKLPIRVSELV